MTCTTCLVRRGSPTDGCLLPERFFGKPTTDRPFALAVNINRNGAPSLGVSCTRWWARRPRPCGKRAWSKATGWWGTCPTFPRPSWRCWRPAPWVRFGVRAHRTLACAGCLIDSNGSSPNCSCAVMATRTAASVSTVDRGRPKSWQRLAKTTASAPQVVMVPFLDPDATTEVLPDAVRLGRFSAAR